MLDRMVTTMAPAQLCEIGEALFGEGFRAKLAKALQVDLRQVQRWCSGAAPIPGTVRSDIAHLLTARRIRLAALALELGIR